MGQKNHPTSRDKKKHPTTRDKKKKHPTTRKKKKNPNPLKKKKITQPLRSKKITQPLGLKNNHPTSLDKKKSLNGSKLLQMVPYMAMAVANGYGNGPTLSQMVPNGPKWSKMGQKITQPFGTK